MSSVYILPPKSGCSCREQFLRQMNYWYCTKHGNQTREIVLNKIRIPRYGVCEVLGQLVIYDKALKKTVAIIVEGSECIACVKFLNERELKEWGL